MTTSAASRVVLFTSKDDLAADLIVVALERLGAEYDRVNVEEFPEKFRVSWDDEQKATICPASGSSICVADIRSAWFRRLPAKLFPSRFGNHETGFYVLEESRAIWEGLWHTSTWLWMNRPAAVHLCENKLSQLSRGRGLGFHVPRTLVSNDPIEVRRFARTAGALVAKPLAVNRLDANRTIYTTALSFEDLADDSSIVAAPCIFQERIERVADVRVTVVGNQCFAAEILVDASVRFVDWRAVDEGSISYSGVRLPSVLQDRCIALVQSFGLTYGAIDLLRTASDDYVFLEINPSGQWGWIEQATGHQISDAMASLLVVGELA